MGGGHASFHGILLHASTTVRVINRVKPNSTQEAEEPNNRGAVRIARTGHFQAPARQLTPQANLKATPADAGMARGYFL
jgi:hypothetical protein